MKTFLTIIVSVLACENLFAQNTIITWSALDMGFAAPASSTTELRSVAGQMFTGGSLANTTTLESGFLSGLIVGSTSSGSDSGFILYSRRGNPDGTIWMRATNGSFDTMVCIGAWPRLSHNGRYIVHHRGASPTQWLQDLYVYDLQTRRDTLLTFNGSSVNDYSWSDNDNTIVFDFNCVIQRINRDGTNRVNIMSFDCLDDVPMLKSGSSAMAFHNLNLGIMLTDPVGVNRHVIPNTAPGDYEPAWSPDGQWIAFARAVGDTLRNYYKIHPDGTSLTPLTFFVGSQSAFNWAGAWSPDGSKLFVPGRVNGVQGIYAIATSGSGGVTLVPTAAGAPIDFVGSVKGATTTTSVSETPHELPVDFQLDQNYPNPFNPSTTISYALPKQSHVRLTVYNVLGQEIATLVDGIEEAGFKSVQFDAAHLASGVYFYRITSGSFERVRKLLLLK